MQRSLVALSALVYLGIGLACIIAPVEALQPAGVTVADDRGIVELRAMYGGLELGMAAFLAWTLLDPSRVRTGLVAATCSIGGMGIVRTAAWLHLQPDGVLLPFLCAIELLGGVLGAWALTKD